jgi:hypothetical protein
MIVPTSNISPPPIAPPPLAGAAGSSQYRQCSVATRAAGNNAFLTYPLLSAPSGAFVEPVDPVTADVTAQAERVGDFGSAVGS